MNYDALTVASRAWMRPAEPEDQNPRGRKRAAPDLANRWRHSVLIFDTETTTDATQRLTFGCYRFAEWEADNTLAILEEGLIYADDLPATDPVGFETLQQFAIEHVPDTIGFYRSREVQLRSQRDFLDGVLWECLRQDALIVGFNLPFDISRLSSAVAPARGKHLGGFSFTLWTHTNEKTGMVADNQFRPRIRISQIDSKRSRIDITQPKGRPTGRNGRPVTYKPGFLDLRTLAFALTDRGYSLRSACDAFGVTEGKSDPGEHGRITSDYIAYARQDVKATGFLLEALRADFDRHPIGLDPCHAFSPATIAKAYYRAMGVIPRLWKQPNFSKEKLGYAMSAYYGGRAECGIRRTPVPIVYTDVLSMYPTVNCNMNLWQLQTAQQVRTRDCTAQVRELLASVAVDSVRDPAFWQRLRFFAQIVPDGDILPVRAKYSPTASTFNVGVNRFSDDQTHWYAGPDLVASMLLSGKIPNVVQAFELIPWGTMRGLLPVKLRGAVDVDPASGDFFQTVIEERKRSKTRPGLSEPERGRLDQFLKVLANSGSYGVFVESNPKQLEKGKTESMLIYGPEETPFEAEAVRPETPGMFCFPPVAALITAGARLMLALLERLVRDAGGHYAFCDTDSMAIVATQEGELVPCAGGAHLLPDGRAAIRALSWGEVDAIVQQLEPLFPYDRAAVPGTVLEIEKVNFDPETGARRQLWCMSIAAKRYVLFTLDDTGEPTIQAGTTRHGLGYLIDPHDASERDGLDGWEHALWLGIVRERLGLAAAAPEWRDRPAVMSHTVSSPLLLKAFEAFNRKKTFAQQVKPFNFMLAATLDPFGRPLGVPKDASFLLVSPFESNPRRWLMRNWFNVYDGKPYKIATGMHMLSESVAVVRSLGFVADAYPFHPESKRSGPDGVRCGKETEGLLSVRNVRAAGLVCVGKEAHRLEERDLVADLDELQNVFTDPRRSHWNRHALPNLEEHRTRDAAGLSEAVGIHDRSVRRIIQGNRGGSKETRTRILSVLGTKEECTPRTCAVCGQSIASSDPRKQYCSHGCANRASVRLYRSRAKAAIE